MKIELHTDGGSSSTGGAACASIIKAEGKVVQLVSYLGKATNNQAEIIAGLQAFAFIKSKLPTTKEILWHCDSQYALGSATQYINNWQRNGWRTANKVEVKNVELWKIYLELTSYISIMAKHVKGHSGNTENEACDKANVWLRKEIDALGGTMSEGAVEIETEKGVSPIWQAIDLSGWLSGHRAISAGDASRELIEKINESIMPTNKSVSSNIDISESIEFENFSYELNDIIKLACQYKNLNKEDTVVVNYLKDSLIKILG